MMGQFAALAWNGFREARRNRVTMVVGVFAGVVLLCTSLVTEITINTFARVMTDFGLGSMSIILCMLAVFLSCGLLSREIERRTIFLIVSKPLPRAAFVVARLFGNMLTLTVLLLAMFAIFILELGLYHQPLTQPQVASAAGLWFELWVLSSVGFLLSSFSSQVVSAVVTVGIYFSGHLSADIYNLAMKSKSPVLAVVGKATYYLVPNLERMNFRPMAAYELHVPLKTIVSGSAYGLAYAGIACTLAVLAFERRDFR
jgi:ABC-type transport system involved in multi-copper enzyme maturation permease subunit